MSASHRGLAASARALAPLLTTGLAGLLLTALPAAAAPADTGPPSSLVRLRGVASEVAAPAPSAVTLQGSSPAPGEVELSTVVSSTGGLVSAGSVSVSEAGVTLQPAIPLADGVATYRASDVYPGAHRYRVSYGGTDTIAAAQDDIVVDVRDRATARLRVTPGSPAIGVAHLEIVVLTGDQSAAAGSVDVRDENGSLNTTIPVSYGVASFEKSGVRPGRHRYVLDYSGSHDVQPTRTRVTVVVRDRATADLAVTSTSAAVGRLRLRVGVTAAGEAVSGGTVTIKEGTRTVASKLPVTRGEATWSASRLPSGKHTYVVRYAGTATVKDATTTHVALVKARTKPVLTLTGASPAAGAASLAITVEAAGQPDLGGSVKITEGATTVASKVAVQAGRAVWSSSTVPPGRHTYTVTYSGTSQVASRSGEVTVRVRKG